MVELLVSMLIISIITLLAIHSNKQLDTSHYYFMNEYLYKQSLSMKEEKQVNMENGIFFNSMGRVNMAKTIRTNRHPIIIHLGNGYITYEQ